MRASSVEGRLHGLSIGATTQKADVKGKLVLDTMVLCG